MLIDPSVGLTIYSALGTSPRVKQLFSSIREKYTGFSSYEKTLFKCYGKAIKKEIRKKYRFSLKRFNLKWEVALLQDALNYFGKEEINNAKVLLEKYYGNNGINFNSVKKNYEDCLKKHSDFSILTHIVIEGFKSQEERMNSLIRSKEISDELRYKKTFDVTVKTIEEKIANGELLEAYYRIKSIINLDELNRTEKYRSKLILFETKIILMRELSDEYKVQLEKLELVENCFLKFYYKLRFFKLLKMEIKIENFIINSASQRYTEELRLCYLYLINSDLEYINNLESKFPNVDEESKIILLKNYLISCVNSYKSDCSEKLLSDNQDLLTDFEARFYLCILELNKFWKSKSIAEFSRTEVSFLQDSLEEMLSLEKKFIEYSVKYQSSIKCNIALSKISLGHSFESLQVELEYFINELDLLMPCIKRLNSSRRFKDIIQIINNSSLKLQKGLVDEFIDALFKDLNFETLTNEKFIDANLSIDSKAKIVTAKNILTHQLKKKSFSESEIELLSEDLDHPIVLESICHIFIINDDKTLAEKYFSKLYQNIDKYSEDDKLVVMKLAELLGKSTIEEKIIDDLIELREQYKIAKAKYYQRISNNFKDYIPKVDHFFSAISIEDDLPVELFRIKTDYLRVSGETDKFLELIKNLIDLYSDEGDWFVYVGSLVDLGMFEIVEKLIPDLEKRVDNPLFELILSICFLNTGSSKQDKLAKFYYHFFQAFRKIKEFKQKFSDDILSPILYSLLINQLFIEYEKKYVSDGCFIELQNEKSGDKIKICIHIHNELSIPFEEEYLNAKHLYKDDEIVKEILLKEVGDEIVLKCESYKITKVDSILNYPNYYLSEIVYSSPEKYGLKKYEIGPDPVVSIFPQMLELKKQHEQVFNKYSINKSTLNILASRDYINYIQIIQRLLFDQNLSFNAGFGQFYKEQKKFVISYSSLLILELFDKLRTIPEDRIIIPKSLIDAANKHYQIMRSGIDNSKLSLDLDENLIPYKIETSPDINLKETRRWQNFCSKLERFDIIDTVSVEDDLTPVIRLIGKIEVDCIRISRLEQVPIIIDDHLIQQLIQFNGVSNLIGLYFFHSSDCLEEKLRLLLALSRMDYKYLLFNGLIEEIINQIIRENYSLFGENTVNGNFIELIKYELSKEDKNLQYEYFLNGCNLLVQNFLNPLSERILKNLVSFIRANDKVRVFKDLSHLNQLSDEKVKFIKYCFS